MWIYSQTKEELIDAKVIFLQKIDGKWAICTCDLFRINSECEYVTLGRYKSYVKASDVLEILRNRINRDNNGVFDMPKDEE